eukprot:g6866.t1
MNTQQVTPPVQRQQQDPTPGSSQPAPTSASSSLNPTSPAIMPASATAGCQYPGCFRSAKYGPQDPRVAPPIACQSHKRAGQFTVNRRGELLKATRDGEAFRTPAAMPTVVPPSPPADSETAGTAETAVQRQQHSTGSSASSSALSRPKSSSKLKVPPTPAQTHKQILNRANRPRLLSGCKQSPRSRSQTSSCLFPGCDTLPTYGLPGAVHAVYCSFHKKGAMVLISEDASDTPEVEGKKTSVALTAVKSKGIKARPPPTAAGLKKAKKARRIPKDEQEGGRRADGRDGEQGVKNGGDGKAAGRAAVAKKSVKAAAVGGSRSKMDPPSSSPSAVTTPTTPENEKETAATAVQTRPPPPPPASTNRLADKSGMSPSGEFLVLKKAREAAKREAEASGGGRRPRAPSRRALEASGRMQDEGLQWMSREKKAEEARAKKELREQRRQYRAAGLSVGVVVEAYVANGTAAATGTGSGAVDGGGSGDRGVAGLTPAHDESGWRKVSPALLTALLPPKKEGEVAAVAGEMPGNLAGSTAAANSA